MSKGKNSQPGQSPASRRRWSPEYSGARTSRRCEGLTFRVSVLVTSAVPTVCRGLDRPSPAPSTVISDSPGTVTLTLLRSRRGTWLCGGSRACPRILSTSDRAPGGAGQGGHVPSLPSGASAGGTAANTQGRVASAWPRVCQRGLSSHASVSRFVNGLRPVPASRGGRKDKTGGGTRQVPLSAALPWGDGRAARQLPGQMTAFSGTGARETFQPGLEARVGVFCSEHPGAVRADRARLGK